MYFLTSLETNFIPFDRSIEMWPWSFHNLNNLLIAGHHGRNIFLDSSDGFDIEFINQYFGHVR